MRCFVSITLLSLVVAAHPKLWPHMSLPFDIHNVSVDGVNLFYREAGDPSRQTILLLHGYPSSSHEYRHLIPILAERYHVLAPDYPGFGFTTVPAARNYTYTFDNLAHTISEWLELLKVDSFVAYVFDYGAPVGFRLAVQNPKAIKALVSQNGNAYIQGLGDGFHTLSDYFNDPTNKTYEQAARDFNTYTGVVGQYFGGVPDPQNIEPESYTLDAALLARPGNEVIQLALFRDYKSNVASYPKWQQYLRKYQPPLLAVWGKNDPVFIPAGANAFKTDVPEADVVLLDGGHFLLETRVIEVGRTIVDFLQHKCR